MDIFGKRFSPDLLLQNLIQRLKTEKLVKTFKNYNNFWLLDQILKTRITWSVDFRRKNAGEDLFLIFSIVEIDTDILG